MEALALWLRASRGPRSARPRASGLVQWPGPSWGCVAAPSALGGGRALVPGEKGGLCALAQGPCECEAAGDRSGWAGGWRPSGAQLESSPAEAAALSLRADRRGAGPVSPGEPGSAIGLL